MENEEIKDEVVESQNEYNEDESPEVTEDEPTDEVDDTESDEQEESELEKLKKENGSLKRDLKKAKKTDAGQSSDEVTRLRLETRGITEAEDQDYVMRMAKAFEVSVTEAVNLPEVKAKLEANKEVRATKEATSSPSKRAGISTNSVDYWIKKGELPKDTELRRKVVNTKLERAKQAQKFAN